MIISTCLVLAACSNEDLVDSPNTNDGSIRFGNVATRAEVSDASQINSFKVFAEMNLGEDATDEASTDEVEKELSTQWVPLFSEGELVSRVGSSNDWTYENKRYWVDNCYFCFYGFYPSSLEVTRTEDADGWVYSSTISVPYAADTDFMTADEMVHTIAGFEPTVQMSFKHRLARVVFNISKNSSNSNNRLTIKSIGFSGISRNAKFEVRNSTDSSFEVVEESRNVLRTGVNTDIKGIADEGKSTPVLYENGLLLIPQKLKSGEVMLNISYEFEQSGAEVELLTLSAPIPVNDDHNEWESGTTYVYNLTLTIDRNIYISAPTVEHWGVPQPGGIIIVN